MIISPPPFLPPFLPLDLYNNAGPQPDLPPIMNRSPPFLSPASVIVMIIIDKVMYITIQQPIMAILLQHLNIFFYYFEI
ncbi:hypothetical protein DERF_003522 [Dermatophagoides farinae]|uniref:Uncharacterized protein n=1 Tax=Dermatophagoides farinae TaxID=6954 RepID=A0A922IG23_DERFA|nr:hypothetical protein DERF_003522 [Dermatophagoides farinae]